MAGYVRQSAADIVPTAVVRAAPINNEYNALRDAFAVGGGHKHDGTAAEGHPVPVIGDSDLLNKIATDTGNNRHGVFVEVGAAAVEQIRFQDGAIVPVTDNDIDFGTSALEFKDLYIDGTANIDSLVADTADINGGTIDATVVGASTPAAGTFTALTANTSLVAASVDINAGTVDGTVIGASVAQAITGTTVTATAGFVGGLTGAVTGNTAGTHTGAVVGNVTGTLTGNVTASTGTSTFNDVTINGGLNMDASSAATITNLTSPVNSGDAATKGYVDTSISNLVASAPGVLDTLDELAAALGDDANFATTVTNSIATKLALAGGTMTGAIAMGTNKITGLGTPTANQDAATKTYVDTADALKLSLSGGTMTGAIAMGTAKITGMGDPTNAQDAATKNYVDTTNASNASAAASAAAAAVSAGNAATSEGNAASSASAASSSASAASGSASAAAASYDSFDDRYLGPKASSPTLDNDGNALLTGALYFDTAANEMRVYTGTIWKATGSAVNGTAERTVYTATASQTTFAATYDVGYVDVYLNGAKLQVSVDFTATNGVNIVLTTGATSGDIVDIVAYAAFELANVYTQAQSDVRYAQRANNLSDLASAPTARTNLGLGTAATTASTDYATSAQGTLAGTALQPAAIGTTVQAYDADLTTLGAGGSGARSFLGLAIGADVQAYDADLTTLGAGGSGARSFLGLAIGTDVQAYDADLTTLGAGGSGARSFLGLAIGTDVQAWDADLDTWATKTAPSGTVVGTTDSQTLTNKTLTAPVLTTPNITIGLLLNSLSGTAGQIITSAGSGNVPVWADVPPSFSNSKALFFASF